MASKISNIRTYHDRFFGTKPPSVQTIDLADHMAEKTGINIAADGRAYAPFKRPLTKREMQALNARKGK